MKKVGRKSNEGISKQIDAWLAEPITKMNDPSILPDADTLAGAVQEAKSHAENI